MSSFFSRSSKKSSKSAASSTAASVASSAATPSITPSTASKAGDAESARTIGPPTSSIIAVAPASSVIPERNYTEDEQAKVCLPPPSLPFAC